MTSLPRVPPTDRSPDRFSRCFSRLALLTALLVCPSLATSFAQTGAPPFLPGVGYETGGYLASASAVGDLNGDGKPDLVVANFAEGGKDRTFGSISVLLGKGDGTFQLPVSYPFDTYPSGIVIADVNGDHKPDLIVSGQANQDSAFSAAGSVFGQRRWNLPASGGLPIRRLQRDFGSGFELPSLCCGCEWRRQARSARGQ